LVYSDDFRGSGNIYLASTAQPMNSTTIDGPANPQPDGGPQVPGLYQPAPVAKFPHVGDGVKPEVTYVKNSVNVNHWPGKDPARWIDMGLWADVVGSGVNTTIVYERVVNGY